MQRDHRGEVRPNCLNLSPHIPFQTESIVEHEFGRVVRVILFGFLTPGISVLRDSETNIRIARGELTVLGMLELLQESGNIVAFSFIEGGFIALGIGLPLEIELHEHIALHLSQLEGFEEEMDAIATQRVAEPGRPIILGPQKLPHIGRQGTERCSLHQCVPVGSIHLVPRRILAVKQCVVKEVPRNVPRLLDDVPKFFLLLETSSIHASVYGIARLIGVLSSTLCGCGPLGCLSKFVISNKTT